MAHKKGLKLNNQTSSIKLKEDPMIAFEQKADDAVSRYENYKHRSLDLTTKFKSILEDKILLENKSIISKDMEKEVLDKLIALASDMNIDESQPEGIGGIVLSMLLMKMMLLQRDRINDLEFRLEKLAKQQNASKG